jgi:hypothetical protein
MQAHLRVVRCSYSNRRIMCPSDHTNELKADQEADQDREAAQPPPSQLALLLERVVSAPAVWARMAASRNPNDRSWQFGFLEVITGAPPDAWAEATWEYGQAIFSSMEVPGLAVGNWFQAGELKVGSVTVPLSPQYDVSADRRGSTALGTYQRLLWPTVTWTTQMQTPGGGVFHGELVAGDAPAFLNFDQAAVAFFRLPERNRVRMDMQQIVFREQDLRARIKEMTVRAADVTVIVEGDERAGKRITLGGPGGRSQLLDDRMFGVTFELPDGIPEGGWIALHADRELLDSRVIDPRWQPAGDVKFEIEPTVRLEAIISQGENTTFEAKRELPGDEPDRVMKTVAAFANGAGGTIIFGVDDEMQIVGLADTLNRQSIDRVTSLISDRVHPHVVFDFEAVTLRGERVLALHIYSGAAAARSPLGQRTYATPCWRACRQRLIRTRRLPSDRSERQHMDGAARGPEGQLLSQDTERRRKQRQKNSVRARSATVAAQRERAEARVKGAAEGKRRGCLFCRQTDAPFDSVEPIFPESLGNTVHLALWRCLHGLQQRHALAA